jgi:hypothetical protein
MEEASMGPMVPSQMAFLRRWPWRTRSKGPALSVTDELVIRRERRRLKDLDDSGVDVILRNRRKVVVDEA